MEGIRRPKPNNSVALFHTTQDGGNEATKADPTILSLTPLYSQHIIITNRNWSLSDNHAD